jgi:D-serine deaminase-like pyridoxal phosphate-dependent protein
MRAEDKMLDVTRETRTADDLPIPPLAIETPCFVILEDAVMHNLARTAAAAGGIGRLMPHVKTHRAPWLVERMLARGVAGFKTATPAEVEMALAAGAPHVVWAYPTVNRAAIARVIRAAAAHPGSCVDGLVDSAAGVAAWTTELALQPAANVRLRIDLDPGLGRTGLPIWTDGIDLARGIRELHPSGRFAGWHIYDGHIHDAQRSVRAQRVDEIATLLHTLLLITPDLGGDVIAGGSYSFDLWPAKLARFVSPGSFTYSSSEHAGDLADLGWRIAGYVVATVISTRGGTATLDAGAKAISPDKPMKERFAGAGAIQFMNEEHVVVATDRLEVGERVALVPRHACTAAYLYERALVRGMDGQWEYREQMGAKR